MSEVAERHRARSMKEMGDKMTAMFKRSSPSREPFKPRSTDVIISPFSKCGTTWLQQMFHTLRTRGDIDFDDISRVVPWIEMSPLLGIDLNEPQRAEPRGFKSHMSRDEVPEGARYIVSIRDPRDALVSMYKFMEGWFLEPGAVPIDEFARASFLANPDKGYWHHLRSWWDHKDDDNVLLMSYEGMKADPEGTIRSVAAFCEIALDEELLRLTLDHSSLEFMLANKEKFDDRLMRELSEKTSNLPSGSDSAKVRKGEVGDHVNKLGPEVLAEMDRIWRDQIESRYGYRTYAELEEALRESLAGH